MRIAIDLIENDRPRMKSIPVLLTALSLAGAGCNKPETAKVEAPETLVQQYDEKEMDAAIAKAKSKVDEFIAVLQAKDADSFSVKAPITDEHGTEHFWITGVNYAGGEFSGKIGNEPGIVANVKMGDDWKVKRDEISDWMFMRGERIHGGFTIDPLLGSYPQDQADELRAKLVR